ncbi:MAG TPA: EAL domain-containing protein [Thermoanaerobaculia bacterium]|nr:EAL domain-containing protein [Thermoanaerobaculia bacterium]
MRILIVEDERGDARLLRLFLDASPTPFASTWVATVERALEELASSEVDLALVDLGLPDARELEALDVIERAAPALPVIVVTGRDDEQLAARALHHGAEDYLIKGAFDRHALNRAIRYAIERSRSRTELSTLARKLQAANDRLEGLVLLDPLTELFNRRGLEKALANCVDRVEREGIEALAFFIDLDHFKRINDEHGHAVGDVLLVEIASRLHETLRPSDSLGRIGGDEFLAILPRAVPGQLETIGERLRLAVASAALDASGRVLSVTGSVAGFLIGSETTSLDALIARMHSLLRLSKDGGRNRVCCEGTPLGPAGWLDTICEDLRRGRGVHAVLQPIFRLSDLTVSGFELLSRFTNGRVEAPDEVFRLCAERNLLTLADHQCLRTCVSLSESLPRTVRRHLNIFPTTLMRLGTHELLDLFGADPRLYCLELSEQQMSCDMPRLQRRVESVRASGLRIACDDVGFGRSHLESLVLLEPDVVKIDKRCVRGIARDERARRHLGRFISIARKLDAEVVAEGIETEADLRVLRELGVDFGQGFLWGVPSLEMPRAV